MKGLGQSRGDRCGARPLEAAHGAIADRTRWNRTESRDIEHASGRGVCDVSVSDAIGTLERAPIGKIEVARVVARACGWGQVRAGFPEAHRAYGPSAKDRLGNSCHVSEKSAIAAYRYVVRRRDQQPVAPGLRYVAAIGREVKSVGHRGSIDDFGVERRWRISADIAQTLRPDMTGL